MWQVGQNSLKIRHSHQTQILVVVTVSQIKWSKLDQARFIEPY